MSELVQLDREQLKRLDWEPDRTGSAVRVYLLSAGAERLPVLTRPYWGAA